MFRGFSKTVADGGRAGGGSRVALLNIAGVKVVSLTSLWLFLALSAPFAIIVVMGPSNLVRSPMP